jgi:hypothetical protein
MAFGNRPFEVTNKNDLRHVQVRGHDELWHKENLLNIGFRHICQMWPDAEYFAWVDADVFPTMMDFRAWFEEAQQQLQHYKVIQMFDYAMDMDPDYSLIGVPQQSFMSKYTREGFKKPIHGGKWSGSGYNHGQGHPGYAWAATREAIDALGGLIDFAILGAADRHMALALVGCVNQSFPVKMTDDYKKELRQWEKRAELYIMQDVGYLKRSIAHHWHGKKRDRGYSDRWKILIDNAYAPNDDIKYDSQGLLQLEVTNERQMRLRDQIRAYFRTRSEDSIDT